MRVWDAGTLQPKAILFDLDGTLFDRDGRFRELAARQYTHFATALAHVTRGFYVARIVELDQHGYVDKAEVYRDLACEFELPDTLRRSLLDHFWETYASLARSFPEVPEALAALRAKGFRLGIITNGSVRMQEPKIAQLGFAGLFDPILISEREGLSKPDARIFERALQRMRVTAEEAWYVGDHPIADVRGAFDAGLTAVWRYAPHWPRPDVPSHEIRDLNDLVRLLKDDRSEYSVHMEPALGIEQLSGARRQYTARYGRSGERRNSWGRPSINCLRITTGSSARWVIVGRPSGQAERYPTKRSPHGSNGVNADNVHG